MLNLKGFAQEQQPTPAAPQPGPVSFTWGVKIPMRDGVSLNATLFRPKDSQPTPAIFTLTPYIGDSYHARATHFAQHGYAFLLVDCRGRGNSQGEFEPFVSEGRDGHDLTAWIASQPWCDGQVTMWGGSYAGFNQWMTLKENPAQLKTIVPAAAAHAGVDFPFFANIFSTYEIQWQTLTSGVTGNQNLFEDRAFWTSVFQEWYRSQRPFAELDQVTGNLSTVFQKWITHPTPDAYWQQMWLTPAEYQRIEMPILTITGHYDGDQTGAMHYYRQHMLHGSESGKAKHFLVMGPWDHAGTRTPNAEFGGLKFGSASLVDLNKLHREWYAWTMQAGPQPEFLKERVAYYVMGADVWKYAPSLEAIPTQPKPFYLSAPNGQANDVFQAGRLSPEPPQSASKAGYVYDPLDLRIADLEKNPIDAYLTDQRFALNLFGAGLVFHSAPFEQPTEITGWVKLTAWIEMDTPDTDFEVSLGEVLEDGSFILLTGDLLRARYRQSLLEEHLVPAGEILPYTFDKFTFFSRQIAKNSRLRLVLRALNTISYEKNYNSGGQVAFEGPAQARTAHVWLHCGPGHASVLEVPVC